MKRVLILFLLTLVLGLSVSPAVAEEVFGLSEAVFASPNVWDASYRAANLTTSASYVNFSCTLPYEGAVSLSITQEATGTLVYSRDYGVVSGAFRLRGYLFEAGEQHHHLSGAAELWRAVLLLPH